MFSSFWLWNLYLTASFLDHQGNPSYSLTYWLNSSHEQYYCQNDSKTAHCLLFALFDWFHQECLISFSIFCHVLLYFWYGQINHFFLFLSFFLSLNFSFPKRESWRLSSLSIFTNLLSLLSFFPFFKLTSIDESWDFLYFAPDFSSSLSKLLI